MDRGGRHRLIAALLPPPAEFGSPGARLIPPLQGGPVQRHRPGRVGPTHYRRVTCLFAQDQPSRILAGNNALGRYRSGGVGPRPSQSGTYHSVVLPCLCWYYWQGDRKGPYRLRHLRGDGGDRGLVDVSPPTAWMAALRRPDVLRVPRRPRRRSRGHRCPSQGAPLDGESRPTEQDDEAVTRGGAITAKSMRRTNRPPSARTGRPPGPNE